MMESREICLVAHERNRRLARGNNFMAAKSIQGHGKLQDYELLNNITLVIVELDIKWTKKLHQPFHIQSQV